MSQVKEPSSCGQPMANQTFYPTLEEILFLHCALVSRFGGVAGVRDLGLIESALARPRSGYYETLAAQAAALLQSFALNHAFIDGNKRIAFAACAVFLDLNGHYLSVSAAEGERFLINGVIGNRVELEGITTWICLHIHEK